MPKWLLGLIDLEQHTARDKKPWALQNLSAAHTFDYILLRVNFGLIICEDLAMALILASK